LPQSPCPDLLSNNVAPTDFEARGVKNAIETAKEGISAMDAEIARLQRTIGQIKLQRTEFRKFIRSHRSVVSIVRRIPSDILIAIFSQFLHWHSALLRVAGVCCQWRTVALASPLLWNHIHL
ncbi:hypothetical protein GGX14DRAFT_321604, partial [Mycena pura]